MFNLPNYRSLQNFIHPEGKTIILIGAVVTVIFGLFGSSLSWLFGIFTVCSTYFFRNPIRYIPGAAGLFLAPADGFVSEISEVDMEMHNTTEGSVKMNKISIFLSVFDVHVNRIPIDSEVVHTKYHHGAFLNASSDKASIHNEKMITYLCTYYDNQKYIIRVDQIAGFIARRIVNNCKVGDKKQAGEELGIIKFGSRVDLYLPIDIPIMIKAGQTCVGGETIISNLNGVKSLFEDVKTV